jgi:hypothetical protein
MDDSNRELQQSVARDLADDEIGGLDFVVKTTSLCTTLRAQETCLSVARVFLQAITHPALLRCLSIDSYVGTIYRTMGGTNGDRAIALFSNLTCHLTETSEAPKSILALIVSTLYEWLRRERKCLLNDDVPQMVEVLEAKVTQFHGLAESAADANPGLDNTSIQIDMIRRMMDGARGRLTNSTPSAAPATTRRGASAIQSTFPMEVVIPGGNHDNDFADITKIEIFPTLGEVTSDVAEYLPTTDFTRPHFLADPVQRHLDAAFRLLRHDIFGPLKEVIGSVLAQPDVANSASFGRFTGNIRAYSYGQASIEHVFIDNGLQAILSFARPPQLRRYSSADQRRWWDESSRLEQGRLVCFVSTHGDQKSFLVFVVTKKSTREAREENESTLVSDHLQPAITAKLVSETQSNLAMLNRMYVGRQQGLLIELPGLIPETFVPILENLQYMTRDGHLAFQRWILPPADGREGVSPTQLSPPAYARHPGFRFRLDTITRNGQPALNFDPAAPFNSVSPEILEEATGLDRGQSESLIAALTREYALIQGPPGTGKSYVGVQLVRVLLDHKDETEIGPILVM